MDKYLPEALSTISNVIDISGGTFHTLAANQNGEVFTWGRNLHGELGNGTTSNSNAPIKVNIPDKIKSVVGGFYSSFAVTEDGELYSWGRNDYGQLGDGTTTNSLAPKLITFP